MQVVQPEGIDPDTAGRVADESPRHDWERALIVLGIALLFLILPHWILGDGQVRFIALTELLEHGTIRSTSYSLVGPLFSAPLYWLGKLVLGSDWWVARYNTLVLAGGLAMTASLLHGRVDRRFQHTFFLLLIAASMFPHHVQAYFGEVFTSVLVLVGIAALATGRPIFAWTAMVVGVANSPPTIVGLAFVALKHVRETRRMRHAIPVVIAAALILFEWWLRGYDPVAHGYVATPGFETVMPYSGRPGFSYPFFFGLLSITLSFGKGILFFAPGLLLRLGSEDRNVPPEVRTLWTYSLWFLAGLVVVYAKWWAWYGGWFWGPRFFLIASIPASLAIAVKLRRLSALSLSALGVLVTVLTLSFWVGVNGAVFDLSALDICRHESYSLEALCWYTPEFSVLWHPFITPPASLSLEQVFLIAYCGFVYVWLSAPLARTLVVRMSDSLAGSGAHLRTWRF